MWAPVLQEARAVCAAMSCAPSASGLSWALDAVYLTLGMSHVRVRAPTCNPHLSAHRPYNPSKCINNDRGPADLDGWIMRRDVLLSVDASAMMHPALKLAEFSRLFSVVCKEGGGGGGRFIQSGRSERGGPRARPRYQGVEEEGLFKATQ